MQELRASFSFNRNFFFFLAFFLPLSYQTFAILPNRTSAASGLWDSKTSKPTHVLGGDGWLATGITALLRSDGKLVL